jgi:type II secretory pathway component PulM
MTALSYAAQAKSTVIAAIALALLALGQMALMGHETLSAARSERSRLERLVSMPAEADDPPAVKGLAQVADAAAAGSALQDAVNRSAEAKGFKIENLQLLEPVKRGGLTEVTLRVNGVIPEQSALPFLAELADAEPSITARTVELQKVPEMALLDDGQQATDRMLAIRLELSALAVLDPGKTTP